VTADAAFGAFVVAAFAGLGSFDFFGADRSWGATYVPFFLVWPLTWTVFGPDVECP
jgi:hypothetical protein